MGNCFLYKRGMGSAGASEVIYTAMGKLLTFKATDKPLKGLRIFGKTTQNGTPTPDAPVPFVSAGDSGSVGVTVCGKNMMDSDKLVWKTALPTKNDSQVLACKLPAGEYVFSTKTNTGIMRINVLSCTLRDEANKAIKSINSGSTNCLNGNSVFSLTEEEAASVTNANLYYNHSGDTSYTSGEYLAELQIERGSVATAYEPYKGQTLILSTPSGLPGIPVSSGGNYTDATGQQWICDEVDFARGKYVQRIEECTIDGSENWRLNIGYPHADCWYAAPNPKWVHCAALSKDDRILCNIATGGDRTKFVNKIILENKYLNLSLELGRFSSIDELKAYFANNPAQVKYVLAEENLIPLSAEELSRYAALHTNYPSTTIFNDAGAWMEVKYL